MSDLNDSLDGLFGGPAITETPRPSPPAWAVQAEQRSFTETCNKCQGTGMTRWGRCFRCSGKGGKSFKTSPEQRSHNRDLRVAREARNEQATLDAFAAAHPAVHAWIVESAPTFEFAASMLESVKKWGSLTERQLAACERAVAKRAEARTAREVRVEAAPTVTVEAIERAFEQARGHGIKSPKLRLDAFTFKPAKATSANAGAIYVTEGDLYLGKIAGGRFLARRECGDERSARIVAVASNPGEAAVAYGHRTGSCACCGRLLTVTKSVELGIGPVCRARFGWGE